MQFHPDAAKIKRWREERHWSQDHLADLAGIGSRTVQRIENGEKASYDSVMALAAAFNVDVVALTVDPTHQAAAHEKAEAIKAVAAVRLSLWIHLGSYILGMVIFLAISASSGGNGFVMLVPALWWTVGLAGHALTVFIVTIVVRFNHSDETV